MSKSLIESTLLYSRIVALDLIGIDFVKSAIEVSLALMRLPGPWNGHVSVSSNVHEPNVMGF